VFTVPLNLVLELAGVDVKACSFVAAFDEIQNMKSFIQMKGRARQEHAKFFVFENDANVGQTIESYQRTELKLHAHLSLRKSLTRLRVPYNIRHWQRCGDRDDDLELHAIEDGFFETRHGMVLADDAKSLLFRYTFSIPMEASVRASRESLQAHMPFFDYVKGQLTLPAHIASTQRVVSLPKNPIYLGLNKRDMEKMLCLMACVRLHKLKLLNDRLLPMSKDFLLGQVIVPISVPASSRGSTSPNEETCQTQKGSQSVEIFIYPILQQSAAFEQFRAALCPQYIDLAIITMESFCPTKLLPAFTIHHSQFATMSCRLGTEKQTTCSVDEFRLIAEFFGIIFTARWKSKSGSFKHGGTSNDAMRILSDYRVGCVDEHGELQFSVMRRTIDESTRTQSERVHAVRQMAGEKGRPRLWRGIDDETRRYIAYHLSDEIARAPLPFCDHSETSTIQTYEDYYRLEKSVSISSSEPLVVAQHLWRFPRRTEFSENDTANVELFDTEDNECNTSFCRGLTTVRLPLCLFEEMPILADPGLLLLSTFLPQFLYTFERHANASSLVNYCSDRLPLLGTVLSSADIGDIVTVLTAKSCSESRTYDKFEWLGDAVLKLAQTDAILGSVRLRGWVNCLHEGQLDDIRSALTENKRLAQVCMAVGLDQFILTQPLSRGRWTPFTLEHTSLDSFCQVEVQRTPDSDQKMLADVVEAILGLAYLQSDYEKVLLIAHEFQATIPWEKVPWEKEVVHKTYFDSDVIATITNLSEYTFESGQFLLREALTHPTQLDPETSSYQRLEWVGDAVLCLAVRDWIYRHQPNLGLGEMVLMESSLVSNETLGFLSHRIGLCGHLRHCDTTLPGRIADYVVTLEADRRGLWCTDPPKCIADVVESVLGAIHVYAGFDKGKKAALQTIKPIMDLLYPENKSNTYSPLVRHPKKTLHELVGKWIRFVSSTEGEFSKQHGDRMVLWSGTSWCKAHREGRRYVSVAQCDGVSLLSVVDRSKHVATNRASALILAVFLASPTLSGRFQAIRSKEQQHLTKKHKCNY
jgi:dsRNA-specific ribonuclease